MLCISSRCPRLVLRDVESKTCSGLARRRLDVGGVKRNRGGVKIPVPPVVVTVCGCDALAPTSTADANKQNIWDAIILINMLDCVVNARLFIPCTLLSPHKLTSNLNTSCGCNVLCFC